MNAIRSPAPDIGNVSSIPPTKMAAAKQPTSKRVGCFRIFCHRSNVKPAAGAGIIGCLIFFAVTAGGFLEGAIIIGFATLLLKFYDKVKSLFFSDARHPD
jgi:hypothetical protein